jgi:hypothetical protein
MRARLQDLPDLVDGEADLVVCREVVRTEPDAGVGSVVADDVAGRQLGVDGLELGHAEDDGAAADRGIPR